MSLNVATSCLCFLRFTRCQDFTGMIEEISNEFVSAVNHNLLKGLQVPVFIFQGMLRRLLEKKETQFSLEP